MEKKKQKQTAAILWTLAACITMAAALVITTLTPLATIGHGTKFGSQGMWFNLYWCAASYLLPLILYEGFAVRPMKYLLVVLHATWTIALPVMIALAAWGSWYYTRRAGRIYPSLGAMLMICLAALVVNVIWYPMWLRRRD